MERDIELLKKILIELEKDDRPFYPKNNILIEGVNGDTFYYHIKLLSQASLINTKIINNDKGELYYPISLTWDGHEFLDALKNDTAWTKLKKIIGYQGKELPFAIMKELLFTRIRSELNG